MSLATAGNDDQGLVIRASRQGSPLPATEVEPLSGLRRADPIRYTKLPKWLVYSDQKSNSAMHVEMNLFVCKIAGP